MLDNRVYYVDVHSHSYEYGVEGLRSILEELDIIIVVVSDDYASSREVLRLSQSLQRIVPCLGVHPWTVNELGEERALEEAEKTIELAIGAGVRCLGEVGLDTKFVPQSIEAQRKVFQRFLEAARDNNMVLNLHTAGTWNEVLDLLHRYDIRYANFHWYTGPPQLLKDIEASGYTISINPALRIQKKHQEIVRQAPLEIMLTESDAPYEYKGIRMSPLLVPGVVEKIAEIKSLSPMEVREVIYKNFVEKWLQGSPA